MYCLLYPSGSIRFCCNNKLFQKPQEFKTTKVYLSLRQHLQHGLVRVGGILYILWERFHHLLLHHLEHTAFWSAGEETGGATHISSMFQSRVMDIASAPQLTDQIRHMAPLTARRLGNMGANSKCLVSVLALPQAHVPDIELSPKDTVSKCVLPFLPPGVHSEMGKRFKEVHKNYKAEYAARLLYYSNLPSQEPTPVGQGSESSPSINLAFSIECPCLSLRHTIIGTVLSIMLA